MTVRELCAVAAWGLRHDPWAPVALVTGLIVWAAAWVILP